MQSAPAHGINFSLSAFSTPADAAWHARRAEDLPVRQACLTVPGAGKTAMCFLSEPERSQSDKTTDAAQEERAWVINAACGLVCRWSELAGKPVGLAQALLDPSEHAALGAYERAGFVDVGTLHYMRRPAGTKLPKEKDRDSGFGIRHPWRAKALGHEAAGGIAPGAPSNSDAPSRTPHPESRMPVLPQGVAILPVHRLPEASRDTALLAAMNASYEETLDCPELTGLRETADILASHRATGLHDPSLWWLVLHKDQPMGCVLFSPCPTQRSFELVYVGLSKALRGHGLGRTLVEMGLTECAGIQPAWAVTCAVDSRNAPALKLYERLGFRPFSRKRAFVRSIAARGWALRAPPPNLHEPYPPPA